MIRRNGLFSWYYVSNNIQKSVNSVILNNVNYVRTKEAKET